MINYKHLHYFWVVAKCGGIARASETLHITPQTISSQISLLEQRLGEALLQKTGRNLELTEAGRIVQSYADEIFSLGGELEEAVLSMPSSGRLAFKVGVAEAVPKTISHRLLAPALELESRVRITCREKSLEELLADLAMHKIDLVIADAPIPPGINIRAYNHPLGESGISFLATKTLAKSVKRKFPGSLTGVPLLVPSDINKLHARLLSWFDAKHIHPQIVGEFDDSALMKVFGQAGTGVFVVPTVTAGEVCEKYEVELVGSVEDVKEEFFAISLERKVTHPAVAAVLSAGRKWLH